MDTLNATAFAAALEEAANGDQADDDGWMTFGELREAFPGYAELRLRALLRKLHKEGRLLVDKRTRRNIVGKARRIPCYRIVTPER